MCGQEKGGGEEERASKEKMGRGRRNGRARARPGPGVITAEATEATAQHMDRATLPKESWILF